MPTLLQQGNASVKSIPLDRMVSEYMYGAGDLLPIQQAYYLVPWMRRGVDLISNKVSTYPFSVMLGDKEIANEQKPQDIPDGVNIFPLMFEWARDLLLYGACYGLYEKKSKLSKGHWRRLHPAYIRPEYDEMTGQVQYFERRMANGRTERLEPNGWLVYVFEPPIEGEIGIGKGKGYTALQSATGMRHVDMFSSNFFKKGAVNPFVVEIEGWENTPESEREKIKSGFNRFFTGVRNAFSAAFMDAKGMKLTQLIQPIKDLAMGELTTKQREDVSTALGVPQTLLFSNAANYATANNDTLMLYDLTIDPFVSMIFDQLQWFFEGNGYMVKGQLERVPVYQQVKRAEADKLRFARAKGDITTNEYRVALGYDEVKGGDVLEFQRQAQQREDDMEAREQRLSAPDEDADLDDGEAPAEDAKLVELDKWHRFSQKRFKEGNPAKALAFESDLLHPTLMGIVKGAMLDLDNEAKLDQVFNEAQQWLAHDA